MVRLVSAGPQEPGVGIDDGVKAFRSREGRSPRSCQHHMRRRLHYSARNRSGRLEPFKRRNRTTPAGFAVHQTGVELIATLKIRGGAPPGHVEARRLQGRQGLDHHIHGQGARGQPIPARFHQTAHVRNLASVVAVSSSARTAVKRHGDAGSRHKGVA